MPRPLRLVLRLLGILTLLLLAAAVATSMGRYLVRAAWEEAGILWRRRPIADLVEDTTTSVALRERLTLVREARDFAARELGLAAGQSFTTYSRLERDTLVLVLSAARRDSLVARTWWFPVVGRFPYKGFFDFGRAQRTARELQDAGFDTFLRPASAFSTLGWFNDPLLSTTVRQPPEALVNTVIHELLHNTVFVKGDVTFNESFASFVGAHGAMAFFAARGDTAAVRRARDDWEDDKVLGTFWATMMQRVDSALSLPGRDAAARVAARDTVYAQMRERLMRDIAPRLRLVDTTRLRAIQLDNAALLARRTYAADLSIFDEMHRREGGDLRRTIAAIDALTRVRRDPFAALRESLTR